MKELFPGLLRAHGIFTISGKKKGKVQGKAQTVYGPVTDDLWDKHLAGEQGLGIVPIQEDSTAQWGAIDIDDYNLTLEEIEALIRSKGYPLLVVQSKSGGAHLYLFLKEPEPAKNVRGVLVSFAAMLGYPRSEVFPKQEELSEDQIGNWINLPYFNAKDTVRYCLHNGKKLTLQQFVKLAEETRVTTADCSIKEPEGTEDGPPCLQILASSGVPQGSRNNALFNFGVYARLRYPEHWEEKVTEYNQAYLTPPLVHGELSNVIGSLRKKTYAYTCKSPPISDLCNRALCLTRSFGIGTVEPQLDVEVTGLVRIETDPVTWYVTVSGNRVELTTHDLITFRAFRERCMEQANVLLRNIKETTWAKHVQHMMQNMTVEGAPEDAGPRGQFSTLFEEFLSQTAHSSKEEDLLRGMPYVTNGRVLFRSRDLFRFLENYNFKNFPPRRVYNVLREDHDARHFQRKVKGKKVNTWSVPIPDNQQTEEFSREDNDVPKF